MSLPPREILLQAVKDHNPAFDGVFFAAIAATGAFCRPSCSEHPANLAAIQFFESAREALAAGFRPCRRCRPLHAGDGDPAWLHRLMTAVDEDPEKRWHDHDVTALDIDALTARRWFVANHGLTFHAWVRLRRLGRTLRQLQLGVPVAEAIEESGFESESAFREAFAQVFGVPPTAVDR